MNNEAIVFGRVLRRLREERNLTQEALAFESDVDRSFISHIEQGNHQPTITTISKLAKGLNTTPALLLTSVTAEGNFGDSERSASLDRFVAMVTDNLVTLISDGSNKAIIAYAQEKLREAHHMGENAARRHDNHLQNDQ